MTGAGYSVHYLDDELEGRGVSKDLLLLRLRRGDGGLKALEALLGLEDGVTEDGQQIYFDAARKHLPHRRNRLALLDERVDPAVIALGLRDLRGPPAQA